jgi:hypothetical protein
MCVRQFRNNGGVHAWSAIIGWHLSVQQFVNMIYHNELNSVVIFKIIKIDILGCHISYNGCY